MLWCHPLCAQVGVVCVCYMCPAADLIQPHPHNGNIYRPGLVLLLTTFEDHAHNGDLGVYRDSSKTHTSDGIGPFHLVKLFQG